MKFYFDGCSFTAGGGFKKFGHEKYKNLLWTHHICDHFNAEEHNFAIGGAANDTILRNFFVKNYDELETYDCFFMQTTITARSEWFDDIKNIWRRYKFKAKVYKDQLRKEDPVLEEWIDYYLKRIYSDTAGRVKEEVTYRSIDSHLKALNKPVFWSTVIKNKESRMDYHLNFKDPNQTTNLPKTRYDSFPDGHPSVEGHRQIAKDVIKIINSNTIFKGIICP